MIKMKKLAMILSMTLLAICCSLGATACDIFQSTCKEHNPVETVITAATCTTDGKAVEKCEACGEETEKTIKATGHNTKTTITTVATCEADGVKTTKCQNSGCGYTVSEKISATGHDVKFKNKNSRAANCQQGAYCGDCKKTYTEPVTTHEADIVPVIAQDPTCTEDGWKAYEYCRVDGCTYSTKQSIAELGHNPNHEDSYEATCIWGAYCGVCQTIYTATLPHIPNIITVERKDPTCDEKGWETYEYCGTIGCTYSTKVEIPMLSGGHIVVETAQVNATCEMDGYAVGKMCVRCLKTISGRAVISALGHDGKREDQTDKNGKITYIKEASRVDTCTSKGYCDICGLEYGEPTHDVGKIDNGELVFDVEGSKAATCTEAAFCAKCKSSYGEALGHILETKEAELYCDKVGFYAHEKCTRKGCTYDTKEVAQPLGHIEVVVEAKAPTCTEDGAMEGLQCSRCEQYLVFPKKILALGHDGERAGQEDERDLLSSASRWKTCITQGYCGLCGSDYGMVNGFHDIIIIDGKKPTCFDSGWYEYEKCKDCNYSTFETCFLPRLQHKYQVFPKIDATCTENGYEKCNICIYCEERPIIEAFGHDINCIRNKNSMPLTCLSLGYCGDCGQYYGDCKENHVPGVEETCTTAQVCLVCGEELIQAKGHAVLSDGTCARCGEQIEAIVKKQDEE